MSSIVRRGRVSGVLKIIYSGVVTSSARWDAIRVGQKIMGTKAVPIAIVDFSGATLGMTSEEAREFQMSLATSDGMDQTVVIYVAGPNRQALEEEARLGNELGRMVEVVDTVDDAYRFLAEMEIGGDSVD